ncbi:MAG: hypothetical protein GY830_02775 [Bacteroidetes bacterium]|nr:hypothetical protein [Bacteroidota bacterium]
MLKTKNLLPNYSITKKDFTDLENTKKEEIKKAKENSNKKIENLKKGHC